MLQLRMNLCVVLVAHIFVVKVVAQQVVFLFFLVPVTLGCFTKTEKSNLSLLTARLHK